jgi:putative ATP-binding cassette transporter
MLGRRGERQVARLKQRLAGLAENFRRITTINRNVGFFSTGYNWLIQLIPVLIVAPAFMRGEIQFGVITQSAMAFTTLVAAFSLVVTQFQSLSTYAAVASRLDSLFDAIDRKPPSPSPGIGIVEASGRLAFENLTLSGPDASASLLKDLSVEIPRGKRTLIAGSNSAAGRALFRAAAGVEVAGSGQIVRPPASEIGFLPQRPYTPPGSLRQVLLEGEPEAQTDERIVDVLHVVGLDALVPPDGDLDREQDFGARVSSREQQLLAFARILLAAPQFVFLDRIADLLGHEQARRMLDLLAERSITVLHGGEPDEPRDLYDAVLECREDATWKWSEKSRGKDA